MILVFAPNLRYASAEMERAGCVPSEWRFCHDWQHVRGYRAPHTVALFLPGWGFDGAGGPFEVVGYLQSVGIELMTEL